MQTYPPVADLSEAVILIIQIVKNNQIAERIKEFVKALWVVIGVAASVMVGESQQPLETEAIDDALKADLVQVRLALQSVIDDDLLEAKEGFNPLLIIALIQAVLKILDLLKGE